MFILPQNFKIKKEILARNSIKSKLIIPEKHWN
jgi:hypothetical protein